MKWADRFAPFVACALVAIHCALVFYAQGLNFATVDEVGHIPSGLSHWQTGSFAAYRVNPPLPRMIAALPLLAAGARGDYRRLSESPAVRCEWFIGQDFIEANAGRYFERVRLARLSTMLWSALAAWVIYLWCRDLSGPAAGVFGAALWCFEPTALAFAQLVTPDVPAAAAGIGATYLFWRYLRRPTWGAALAAGLALGVAQLTKFTMLALYAIWPLMGMLDHARNQAPRRGRQLVTIACVSVFVIHLGYGFRGTCTPLRRFHFTSRLLTDGDGANRFAGGPLGGAPAPVPADYLMGIDVQRGDFEAGLPSYLHGQWRHHGWWYYYLYALAVKLPLGWLALAVWGVLGLARDALRGRGRRDEWLAFVPGLFLLGFVSSQTGFSHHLRYVLPALPFFAVNTARLARFLKPWDRVRGPLVVILFAWCAASSLAVYPHSLSYFNEAAGGPERGHDHLVDSNIDWGQDLLFLKRWLDRHPEARPLGLAYFNNRVDPAIIGIRYTLPPTGPNGLFPTDRGYQQTFGPLPGYYAVSVNFLRGMPFLAPDGRRGWRSIPEGAFGYFRRFRPIARAGYSIYIYRIDHG